MDKFLTGIHFHYLTKSFYFPDRKFTKTFVASIFDDRGKKINSINYIFCSDQHLLALNKRHLQHHYYTDILTFDLSIDDRILADVFISVDRLKENAITYKVTGHSELVRLLIHGALHLSGQNDKLSGEYREMQNLEKYYLNKYWVSRETSKASK